MATIKLNSQAKDIFVNAYNNPEIPASKLHLEITAQLIAAGIIDQEVKLDAEQTRKAFDALNLRYRNRPRNVKESIEFEFDFEEDILTVQQEPVVEDTPAEVTSTIEFFRETAMEAAPEADAEPAIDDVESVDEDPTPRFKW